MGWLLGFLEVRAVPHVEEVTGGVFRRAVAGEVVEWPEAVRGPDPAAGLAHLARDPVLAPLVARTPDVRVPGTVDPAELAIRAVLGQQVSVAAARTHAGRLAAALGAPLARPAGSVDRAFPASAALAEAPDALLAMPVARRHAVRTLAAALRDGLDPCDRPAMVALPGIGPWTADYVRLRCGDPDVLLATDLGVRHAARALGLPDAPRELAARGAAWAPFRSLATVLLWSSL